MSVATADAEIEQGWVAQSVAAEFPGLSIAWVVQGGPPGKSPPAVKARLAELSDRMHGAHAVHLRERPIPWAYRVFFRHIGLDPDQTRTPVEALALKRMTAGGFRSRNRLDDAITIATVETGVAIVAFDRGAFAGPLGIRLSAPGEALEGRAGALAEGTLVVADQDRPLGILFGPMGEGRGVDPSTESIALTAIGVRGVPHIAIEEALWTASAVLALV